MGSGQGPHGPYPVAALVAGYVQAFAMAWLIIRMLRAAALAALRGDANRLLAGMLLIRVITR